MANLHGDFVWYELITPDPDGAQAFYAPLLGWNFIEAEFADRDYRYFTVGEAGIGGVMQTSQGQAMPPAWLGYIEVSDVDAALASITQAGGAVHMPAFDLDGVGRMALAADPQGAPFYVMRGASGETSHSFAKYEPKDGHCAWNELSTSDPAGAWGFYGPLLGWSKDGELDMGPLGAYEFIKSDVVIGAIMPKMPEMPVTAWTFYFRVPDIDAAAAAVKAGGGTILVEAMEIPGGQFSVNALDPQGAAFGLVGPRL